MSKSDNQQKQRLNECVLRWVEKLSTHFRTELDEGQVDIFLHALRDCTTYQVDTAFERCLNECEFMPKLVDVHQRMPLQKWPPENPGAFVQDKPILTLIRPIAEEICKGMTGREYRDLDTVRDARLIYEVFAAANIEHYNRMGLKPQKGNAEVKRMREPGEEG